MILAQAALFDPSHFPVLIGTVIGVTVLMFAIRLLGLALAATHPEPAPTQSETTTSADAIPDPHLLAVIAAATHEATGRPHRILSVHPVAPPSVESLMQQWSMEGRRAIYSSHRVR